MLKRRTIPTNPRYAYAVKRAYEVLADIGAVALPVDPAKISEYYPEINIASYTELQKNTGEADPLFFSERNARNDFLESFAHTGRNSRIDGETRKFQGGNDYLVVYDDRVGSEQRIRWTIAHELGHIFLGHFTQFTIKSLVRGCAGTEAHGGMTEEEYGVLEKEAHCFAAAFLTPFIIIKKIEACKTIQGIQDICDVSNEAAIKRLGELKKLHYGSYEIEDLLNRNFYNFIRKTNNPDAAVFAPQLHALPSQYEDYAGYDYWGYVVASIGECEKNAELCVALTNSTAIYDDGDILIITESETAKTTVDRHGEAILRCLVKYGKIGIESISSISVEGLELLS